MEGLQAARSLACGVLIHLVSHLGIYVGGEERLVFVILASLTPVHEIIHARLDQLWVSYEGLQTVAFGLTTIHGGFARKRRNFLDTSDSGSPDL